MKKLMYTMYLANKHLKCIYLIYFHHCNNIVFDLFFSIDILEKSSIIIQRDSSKNFYCLPLSSSSVYNIDIRQAGHLIRRAQV